MRLLQACNRFIQGTVEAPKKGMALGVRLGAWAGIIGGLAFFATQLAHGLAGLELLALGGMAAIGGGLVAAVAGGFAMAAAATLFGGTAAVVQMTREPSQSVGRAPQVQQAYSQAATRGNWAERTRASRPSSRYNSWVERAGVEMNENDMIR